MMKHGEPFRARAYQKAQETIMSYPSKITSPADLKGKPGIGETILDKLHEFVQTGTLALLEQEKNNPINVLTDVYGIGPKKAKDLVDQGITSIAMLREHQHLLNDVQKVGLRHYEDILKRIPRAEIDAYKALFEQTIDRRLAKMEIVGSYRRGADHSGDIDVIITSHSPSAFTAFVDNLVHTGTIVHILSRGPAKCLVIATLPSSGVSRRVDFLFTTPEEFPFALLYFTGSKIFNTVMRHVALEQGYTMNEYGLYHMSAAKKKGDKVSHLFRTEEDIFVFLGLEYKLPTERTDGRAVIATALKSVPAPAKAKAKATLIIEDDDEDLVAQFKNHGISALETLGEPQLSALLHEANNAYYNKRPIFSDTQYDIVKSFVEQQFPDSQVLREIGAPVKRNKVTLPYPMGSMDKIKPDTNALSTWMAKFKGPYVLSCKLDGVSGLYTTEGPSPKLYTRGDGHIGQDVSHLIPFLRLPKTSGVVLRGEFIIPKAQFDAKYAHQFANPRNMVAGIINQITVNSAIQDVRFVAYELLVPPAKPPTEQLRILAMLDVETVLHTTTPALTNELLSNTLVNWRQHNAYEIDGVIVANDDTYVRKAGNPEHAFAFKMVLSDQIAEAVVVDVVWTASKDGYLKPRVQIDPIQLGGVQITYATGFNGAFIRDHKIGVGTVIELIRSGDVIPYIRKVVVPADTGKMPSVPYQWNDTHVDILLENIDDDLTVREKNITGFFKGLGVEGLGPGNVTRLMEAGYDTVPAIVRMTTDDFSHVFKEKTASKLYTNVKETIDDATLVALMSVSNVFGRGFSTKKIELIMDAYPKVLLSTETNAHKIARISAIKGMASKSAEAFVERIPDFLQFIKDCGLVRKLAINAVPKTVVNTEHPLYGKSVIMTGFRDARLEEAIKEVGGKLGSSVSSNTFATLVKDIHEDTGKANASRKAGVPLMTPEFFATTYLHK